MFFVDKAIFRPLFSSLVNEQNKFQTQIETKLGKKEYPHFVMNYFLISGNFYLLKNATLTGADVTVAVKEEIEKDVSRVLAEFKEYDLEILKVDFQNKYGLTDKEFKQLLLELEKQNKIEIIGNSILVRH